MARGRRHQKWGGQYSIHPWCQQVVHIQVMNLSATAVSAYWWTQPVESKIESSYRGLTTTTKMTPVCVGKSRVEGTKIDGGGGDCIRYCGYLNPSSIGWIAELFADVMTPAKFRKKEELLIQRFVSLVSRSKLNGFGWLSACWKVLNHSNSWSQKLHLAVSTITWRRGNHTRSYRLCEVCLAPGVHLAEHNISKMVKSSVALVQKHCSAPQGRIIGYLKNSN
ncbi:hypothetical protein C8F04DRAFT_1200840 [Mycena alexandri]|uniref:Uncharacterized protein n=1 Tax=Mycena alexandri TaxID=1745969 RepID=A0AAD6RYJ2_9AGAR|nr:hypothetical protein C8F04DRAFT_1200840 [Mycena alexandri]